MPAHADTIVGGMHQILLHSEIAFRRLDTRVSQQQLDLLEFPARGAAESVLEHASITTTIFR
jgi:hypothetical protein